jgi:Mg-chelatase subunit ChlD
MILAAPHWLLFAVPLVLLWWWRRPGSHWVAGLRLALFLIILLAMSEPRLVLPERAGTVVVLADRSASMPADAAARQLEAIGLMHDAMSPDDRLAVVAFGQGAALEQEPAVQALETFSQEVGGDASDLAAGLRRALALLPAEAAGRIVVLSDGRATGGDSRAAASQAAGRGIAIDHREISRPTSRDLAITRVDAPASVQPGASFLMSAWVSAGSPQRAEFELWRGDTRVTSGTRELPAGVTRLSFRDRATRPGSADYRLLLKSGDSAATDPVPENNTGRFIVGVEGERPLLVITASPGRGLARLLRAGGLEVIAVAPDELRGSLQELADFAGVLLENVPATDLPPATLDQLAALVETSGTGLMMTGGQRSFGPGGYFQSPLDPLLPVSMELRQEHRKLSLAIVVALDRSGSMSITVPDGRTKMDLANLGAAQVADLLGPMDEFGVIAVDSAPHRIVDLAPLTDKAATQSRIRSIESMGGGIFVYEALAEAASMLATARAQTRHIILFSDAQDSVNPGQYRELLRKAGQAGITVSVIGLGRPTDAHADLLRDVAKRGNGRVFFTEDPKKLPQLFAQDTFVVARSSFVDELTPLQSTGALAAVTGRSFTDPPAVGGYNLTYLRPDAQLGVVTVDEYTAPLVATWRAGLGRVATYGGEADGRFTGPIADWTQLGDLLSSLARWTSAADRRLPDTMLVRQQVREGRLRVELLLDPEQPERAGVGDPTVSLLVGRPGRPPRQLKLAMRYESPDTLAVEVPLVGDDVALATVDVGEVGSLTLPPTRLLYSPEYQPRPDDGGALLRRLSNMTRGTARSDLGGVWDDLVPVSRRRSVAHWLWLAAAAVLLLEVLERRTAWVSAAGLRLVGRGQSAGDRRARAQATAEGPTHSPSSPSRVARRREKKTGPAAPAPATPTAKPDRSTKPATPPPPPPADLGSVFEAAKRKADERNQ